MVFVVWGVSCGISAALSPVFLIDIMIIIIVIVIISSSLLFILLKIAIYYCTFLFQCHEMALSSHEEIVKVLSELQNVSLHSLHLHWEFTILSYYINITGEKVHIWPSYTNLTRGNVGIPVLIEVPLWGRAGEEKEREKKMREMERVGRWRAWAAALMGYCAVSSESAR